MNKGSAALGVIASVLLAACATPTGFPSNPGGGSGGTTSAGGSTDSGGTAGSGGTTSSGSTTSSGGTGGTTACGTELDQTGCPCTAGEAPRTCWVGAPAMAGVGICTLGSQSCVEMQNGEQVTATWGACTGQGSPGVETCNGLDDNCNGTPDETCTCNTGDTQSCSSVCGTGQEICISGQWVNCNAPPPNPDGTCTLSCNPAGAPPTAWEPYMFNSYAATTPCAGARYVRYMDEYSLWVGAILCNPTRYKLFLGTTKDGVFYQMGDYAGNGQDHCEMVNDAFTIPNEDDVQSGGCAACALGPLIFSDPGLGPVFSRAKFGDCFLFEAQWPQFNLYSVEWYECGVSIP